MAQHKDLTGTDLHEPKDISTATVGQAYLANGAGSGAFSIPAGNNTVIVNQLSDFPTAAAGKITLLSNTSYRLGANINIGTDFLDFGAGTDLSAAGAFVATLTYSGTGDMLVGVDVNVTIRDITLLCATANAYNFSETGGGNTKIVIISDVLVVACLTTGTFDKIRTLVMDGSTVLDCTDGLVFLGAATTSLRLVSLALVSTSTSFVGIDFTGSTQKTVNIDGVVLVGGAGSIGIKGDTVSTNITTGFIANVSNVQFDGVTTALSGISTDDFRWNFQGNGSVKDTMPDSLLSLVSNATATVIAAVNTPVLVAGTWVDERASQYTNTTAGRATYIGERNLTTPIDVSLTMDPASGTNKDIRVYIAINGSVITNSGKTVRIDAGNPQGISLVWQEDLALNDFIEVFVENTTDAIDITVIDANLRVR